MKKLTFTTLRPTHFESFFCEFEVIAFLFTKLSTESEKIVHFSRKGLLFAHLSTTHGESFTLPVLLLISSRKLDVNTNFFQVLVSRPVIEPKSTVSAVDALSTRLMIKMLLYKTFITVLLHTECYAALLIRFSIARSTTLRMKPIVQVFHLKKLTLLHYSANLQYIKNYVKIQPILLTFVTAMSCTFTR